MSPSTDRFFVFFCFGIGTPVYETSDVPGPDEAAADEPGTATSFAFSAAAPEGPVPDEAAADESGRSCRGRDWVYRLCTRKRPSHNALHIALGPIQGIGQ